MTKVPGYFSGPLCIKWLVGVLLVTFLSGCQLKPTKGSETAQVNASLLMKNVTGAVELDQNTIVIDARSAFEYSLAHVPGSVRLAWEDFASPKGKYIGKPTSDPTTLVKRLSLLGISPKSRIVVVGKGPGGKGEEGRLAWSLMHLGFADVQVVAVEYFRTGLNNAEPSQRANVPEWTPKYISKIEADRNEVMQMVTRVLKEGEKPGAYLVDVRSRKEYFAKRDGQYKTPDLRALHIPWEQFFTKDGRPNQEIRTQILGLQIEPHDRIVVISDHGVRSGAAAFALMSLGFTNVANYTGGYQELLDRPKKGPKYYK